MTDRLARIDLNLLVALHVLVQEKNVTKAASRLCITTSAMSKTLNRLKDVLGDPLFERGAHGLILSRRTQELAQPLAKLLQGINEIIFSDDSDTFDIEDTIHIAIPEIFAAQVVSPLLQCFISKSPRLRLATRNVDDDYLDMLHEGHLDYVLYQQEIREGLRSIPMGWHYPVLTMRAGHPLAAADAIDPDALYEFPHIVYYVPKNRYHEFDAYYRQLKSLKTTVWETSQLFTATELLLNTDSVMIGSEIPSTTALCGTKIISKPLCMMPGFETVAADMHLTFHERQENAILHKWFVNQITPICARVLPKRHQAEGEAHEYATRVA